MKKQLNIIIKIHVKTQTYTEYIKSHHLGGKNDVKFKLLKLIETVKSKFDTRL